MTTGRCDSIGAACNLEGWISTADSYSMRKTVPVRCWECEQFWFHGSLSAHLVTFVIWYLTCLPR